MIKEQALIKGVTKLKFTYTEGLGYCWEMEVLPATAYVTVPQLRKACQEKNISYLEAEGRFGIKLTKYVWHWFKHANGTGITFEYSQSTMSGDKNSDREHGAHICERIAKRLNLSLTSL